MFIEDAIAKEKGELYVGMFVTEHGYSDRYGAIVAWVSSSRKKAIMVYVEDDGTVHGNARAQPISLSKDGRWYIEGAKGSSRRPLTLNLNDNFRCPSF